MTRIRAAVGIATILVAIISVTRGVYTYPLFMARDLVLHTFAASDGSIATLPTNVWQNVTPAYAGAPNGGSLTPMTYNIVGGYDPVSQRTISFERWYDPVRSLSIYANGVIAYDPTSNTASVLKLNNWIVQQVGDTNRTNPLPANTTDPTPVDRHPLGGFALDPNSNAIFLVNGANQSAPTGHPNDTWKFSLATSSWTKVADGAVVAHPPSDVSNYSGMVYDAGTRKLAYFVSLYPNGTRTWLFDPGTNQWSQLNQDASAANVYISGAGIAYDTRRNLVLAYGGGYYITSPPSTKLWAYSVSQNRWAALADAPMGASGAEFAYDSTHDVFLALVEQTTLIYNPQTNSWTQLAAPLSRGANPARQNVTYDPAQDVFVFQGGTWDHPVWALFRYNPAGAPVVVGPNTPSGLSATAVSSTQVNLSWTASPTGVSPAGYRIYRNELPIATSSVTSYGDNAVTASSTYTYAVSAYDSAGNSSGQSVPATVTTASATSGQPTVTYLSVGCTTAWFIDEDCDGYGVGVRSSGRYSAQTNGGEGLGDRPDADDTSATLNTTASVIAAYGSGGSLSNSQLKTFLSARRGYTAINNVYYIATTGDNSTGVANDPTHPFKQIRGTTPSDCFGTGPYSSLTPGDLVIYRAGTYTNPCLTSTSMAGSGTAGHPIIYMTYPGEVVHFVVDGNSGISPRTASWAVVDGFSLEAQSPGYGVGFNIASTSNVIFRNLETQNFWWNAVGVDNIANTTIEYTVTHHSKTEHNYYFGSTYSSANNGTLNLTIRRNISYGAEMMGIQHNGRATNLIIEENIIHSNGNSALSLIMGMHDSIVRNNLIFNNNQSAIKFNVYDGDCTYSAERPICPYDQTNNLFTNNTIWIGQYDRDGNGTTSVPSLAAAIQLAHNQDQTGAANPVPCPHAHMRCDLGMGNVFQNNIVYVRAGYAFETVAGEAGDIGVVEDWLQAWTIRNNVFYRDSGSDPLLRVRVLGGASTEYGFSAAQTGGNFPNFRGNTYSNPQFSRANVNDWADPGLFNLRLGPSSPARGFGTATSAPANDITRSPRTSPPDAGAYQYAAGTATGGTTPAAPRNVRIVP